MKNDDIDLIHRILSGDEDAFTTLMQKHRRWVYSLAWREIGDFHAAQEITQDTFIQAFKSLPSLRDPNRFSGWLHAIAKRQCVAWLQKKPIAMQSLDTLPKAELEQLFYTQYLEEERIQASTADLREVVEYLLQKLPVGERSVMVLHYYKGLTCEEMSERLEVSLNTVKSRLYRARKRLEKEESMLRENVGPNLLRSEPRRVDIQTTAATETGDHLAEGGFNFNQTSKVFTSSGFHTKGWGGGDPSPMYMLLHYLTHGWIDLFKFPLVSGSSWEQEGGWKSRGTATVEAYETVNVSAGTFPMCLKHKTVFTDADVEDTNAELRSALVNGTRYLWFAKGVGLVKMRYEHSNGVATEAELLKYETPTQQGETYFPVQIDTQWTYKWHNTYRDKAVIEVWRVIRNFRQLEDAGNPVQLESARYEVSVDANEPRVANVKCILTPKSGGGTKNDRKRLFFSMSRFGTDWLYDGYARSLRDVTATDAKGKALVVEEIAKTQWVVETRDASPVTLQYKVLLDHDERDWPFGRDEAPYAQDDCIFWPGYALFIVGEVDDIELSVDVPDNWSVSTPWERIEPNGHRFVCKNQDDLMYAYLVLGEHSERLVSSGEAEIVLALGGRFKASMDKVASAVEAILQAYSGIFGGTPKGSMLFVMNPYGGEEYRSGGASERSITALIGGALDDGRADFWGPLVANVIGYIWNGKVIHFAEQEYGFSEVNEQEYWFSEGFSKYYSSVICTRLGLISEGDFLRSLELAWESYLSQQGERSIREAGEDKLANRELVYDGGRLIAAALDLQIRNLTKNRSSLDDVMQQMYREFGLTDTAYTMDDVIRIVSQVAGENFEPFFSKYVTGTERLPLEEYLKDVGVDVEIDLGERLPKLGYIIHEMLGIGSFGGPPGGGMFIHRSRKFQDDDRLIGIDGTPVKTRDDIRRAAKDWKSGDVVRLTLEREGAEIVLPVTLEGDPSKEPPLESDVTDVAIRKKTDNTESQRAIWSGILGEDQ
ncbi:MAG: sigma-70 family RNA polymerase sigma factor [Candidatus Poribacteria bacterium]|nr:sigma-70 family RNA polymerase sigma factor [Candidatus Poribacteria bacterium]